MPLKKKIQKTTALFVVFFFLIQMFSPSLYARDTGYGDMHGGTAVGDTNPSWGSGTSGDGSVGGPAYTPIPADEGDPNQNSCSAGQPVSLLTGEETHTKSDLLIPGRGLNLEIIHTYKSRMNYNGRWGFGWFLSYDIKIRKLENNNLLLLDGKGRKDEYIKKDDAGNYDSPRGFEDSLKENTDGSYTRTLKNGITYLFDVNGCLQSITDRNGNALRFDYDPQGKLPISGKSAFFVSQDTGVIAYDYKLSKITDTAGREIFFSYNADGRLTKITDPANREIVYEYDSMNNLIRAYEPAEPSTSLAARDFYTYAYDENHNLISVTDPNGIKYLENVYNDQDRVEQQTYNGETSVFSYNTANRTATMTRQDGSMMYYELNQCCGNPTKVVRDAGEGRLNLTRTYTYDDNMNMISETDPRGYKTYYEYDSKGNITKITDAQSGITRFEYEDQFNQVTKITDALGRITSFAYDNRGNLIRITDALNYQTNFTYDAANGDLLSIINADGKTTRFAYDSHGYMSSVTDALDQTVRMDYDILGNLISLTDQKNQASEFSYDIENQLVQIKDTLGNISSFAYDKKGNRISATDALNHTTAFAYDAYNRIKSITNALNQATVFDYDISGNLKSLTDAEGNITTYEYDTWNRLIRETDALNQATEYAYDANGNLLNITDAKGNITTYEYDSLNRLSKTAYPDTSYESYTYNKVGSLLSKRKRSGDTLTYSYDALNRLINIRYPDATQVSYTYDKLGRMVTANSSRAIQYAYDALNRVTQVTQDGRTVRYEYDAAGNRSRLLYPDNSYISYAYDALNRLDQIKNAAGQILADYTYDAAGRRTQADFFNGTQAVYTYNSVNMLNNLNNKVKTTQAVISAFAYAYDKAGNRTSMTTAQGIHAYTYDKIYQLTRADYPAAYAFADTDYYFDAVANRTAAGGITYTANALNQYSKIGNISHTYDGNGNLSGDGSNTYTYDYENRMMQAKKGTDTVTFAYDAFGRRAKKSSSAGTVFYIYDGDQVIAEYNASGVLLRKFVYGTGIDEPVLMESSGAQYYYHFDGLGSVREISNAAGAVVEKYDYDVYGKMRIRDGGNNVLEKSAVGNPYSFTGRRYDAETGLYHYRARAYSAELGRFLQVDPVGYMDSMNLYAYVLNNPVNYVDFTGKRDSKPPSFFKIKLNPFFEECLQIDNTKKPTSAEDNFNDFQSQLIEAKLYPNKKPFYLKLLETIAKEFRKQDGQDINRCEVVANTIQSLTMDAIGAPVGIPGPVVEAGLERIVNSPKTKELYKKIQNKAQEKIVKPYENWLSDDFFKGVFNNIP